MRKNVVVFLFLITLSFVFCEDFSPDYFDIKYNVYANNDGIESEYKYLLYFGEKLELFSFSSKYEITLSHRNYLSSDTNYYNQIFVDSVKIKNDFFNVFFENASVFFKPKFLNDTLGFYYKDRKKEYYLKNIYLYKESNDDFDIKSIYSDDEIGMEFEDKTGKNQYKASSAFSSVKKEYVSDFYSSSEKSEYEKIKETTFTEIDSNFNLKNYYYYNIPNIKESKIYAGEIVFKNNIDFKIKDGFFKGFTILGEYRTVDKPVINYKTEEYIYNINEVDIDQFSVVSTKTYTGDIKYKIPENNGYEKYTFFNIDANYSNIVYSKNGIILKPKTAFYYKKMDYFIVTLGYDYYMKKEYEFKGLASKEATSNSLGFDFYYTSKNISSIFTGNFIMKNFDFKDNAVIMSNQFKFKADSNNTFKDNINFYTENNTVKEKNFTNNFVYEGKYFDDFHFEFNNYADLLWSEQNKFDFKNIFFTNDFNFYYEKNSVKIGVFSYNTKNRKYAEAIIREFNQGLDKYNWYMYIKFSKVFTL